MFSNKYPYFGLYILYYIHHDLASLEATPQAAKADTEKSVFDQDTLPATETQLEKERSWRSPSRPLLKQRNPLWEPQALPDQLFGSAC
jgi:hypothetical protein